MNATSSRAHTIVAIEIVQKYKNEAGKEMTKSSIINLVDLAGSERQDQTGNKNDHIRFQEDVGLNRKHNMSICIVKMEQFSLNL